MKYGMEAEFEKIGPEKAMKYIETMTGNRSVRQKHVDYLAAQMKAGMWRRTHQGIAFDKEGRLVDGQHRMWAIIESAATIDVMVTRGLSPEDIAALDGGLSRDFQDSAHYSGWGDDKLGAAIAKILVLGAGQGHKKIPPNVVHEWYEFYKDGCDFAATLRLECRPSQGKSMTVYMAAAFARAFYVVGAATLVKMGNILKTGQKDAEADHAAVALRDAWLTSRMGASRIEQYLKTEAAIRAFSDRRGIRKLQRADDELFPIKKLPFELRFSLVNSEKSPRTSKRARQKAIGARAAA